MGDYLPTCKDEHLRGEVISDIKNKMPDIDLLYDLADLFKIFADSTRIRILYLLHEGELCVCEIANALDMTISAVSHQLRVLKNSNLVKYRRDGKTVYYMLADNHVKSILNQGMEHIEE